MIDYEYQSAIVDEGNDYKPNFDGVGELTIEAESEADAVDRIKQNTLEEATMNEWPLDEGDVDVSVIRVRKESGGTAWADCELHRFGIEAAKTYQLTEADSLS